VGGLTTEELKNRPRPNRARELAGARATFTARTGKEPTDVRKAGLYKDFTSLEKKQYASLMKKKSLEGDSIYKKSLLGG
jgi:hypothetical protein